ncbi:hypothetical protein MTO96_015894 [Rhipicephalus appendiculatus]
MGTDASTGIKIRLVDGSDSTFSEESPSLKQFSLVPLAPIQEEAQDDVSCVSSEALEEILPDTRDAVAKPRNKVDQLHQCDLLVDKGTKEETVRRCSTSYVSTKQVAMCHVAVLISAGVPQTVGTMEPSIGGLEPAMSITLQVVECGTSALDEQRLGLLVLGCGFEARLR